MRDVLPVKVALGPDNKRCVHNNRWAVIGADYIFSLIPELFWQHLF